MEEPTQPDNGRRTFCKVCIAGLSAASAAMVGFPIASFLRQPTRLDGSKPVEIPLDRLAPGQAEYIEVQGRQLVAIGSAQGPQVFSASCPHLGCNVIWDTAHGAFHCPCHGAVFDAGGKVVKGPVSGSLEKVPFEVKDGKIIVSG